MIEFVSMQTQRFLKAGQITQIFGAHVSPPRDGWYEITKHADQTVTLSELVWASSHESNRWAAFTDDELEALEIAIDRIAHDHEQFEWDAMGDEIRGELAARVALRSKPA